jgi:hypothetical protein
MFVGALRTFLAKTFHPKVTVSLAFASFLSLAFAWLFLGSGIGRMRTAMSSIIDVCIFSLPINHIVDASNQPFISAMLIAFVISESRSKFNSILWESMVRRHIMLEFWMFLDLSIISGKLELPGRLYLLNQQAEQPFIMELE